MSGFSYVVVTVTFAMLVFNTLPELEFLSLKKKIAYLKPQTAGKVSKILMSDYKIRL